MALYGRQACPLHGETADFYDEFGTALFSASFFAHSSWRPEQEFETPAGFIGPFTLEIHNPSGRFGSVKEGQVLLNGRAVASLSENLSRQKLPVQLQERNRLSVVLKGQTFEGIHVIVRSASRM